MADTLIEGELLSVTYEPGDPVLDLMVEADGGPVACAADWASEELEVIVDGDRVVKPESGYPVERERALTMLLGRPCRVKVWLPKNGLAVRVEVTRGS